MNYSRPAFSRQDWCAKVASLCAPGLAEKGAAALSAMLSDLDHLPDRLFTADTAREVAKWPRKLAIPAYDEVTAALNAYRREFISEPLPMLPAPEPFKDPDLGPNMTTAERDAVLAKFRGDWTQMRADTLNRRIAEESADPESHLPLALRTRPLFTRTPASSPEHELQRTRRDYELLRRSREARGLPPPPMPELLREEHA